MRYRPITKNKEFCRAYARGKAFVHPKLVLYVNKNRLGRTRVGLTATKKIGKAVSRNRCKRIIRAAFHQVEPQIGQGWDFVFVARAKTAQAKSSELVPVLKKQIMSLTKPDKEKKGSAAKKKKDPTVS